MWVKTIAKITLKDDAGETVITGGINS